MFTGIITDLGTIAAIETAANFRVQIQTAYDMKNVTMGASISCNGVCLTVMEKGADWFAVQVSEESRARTTIGAWQVGQKINLERALAVGDELGGHFVSGHVDGIGRVKSITKIEDSWVIEVAPPPELMPLIAPKGSICLDGISLTVNDVMLESFTVTIIPHTYSCTNFHLLQANASLNIEVDLIARYLQRIISQRMPVS
ncbi:MAG TPA: riboflavin synthase [Alphaproteobacteria bacterium]|nr:riboflavin synthase [Alphaproteobacteria bacterium]